jgi:hypothetical protein
MTPQFYLLLAFFLAVVGGLVFVIIRMTRLAEQADAIAKRQDESDAATREQIKVAAEKLDQRLQRQMDADAKAQQSLDALIRAQHAAIEANSQATQQLAGAVADLRAAVIESTKL